MKNYLLSFTMAALVAAPVIADDENQSYNCDELGQVNGISENGRYAAISDDDNAIAYLWKVTDPAFYEDICMPVSPETTPAAQRVVGTYAYGVSNNMTVVGAIKYANGLTKPAYYKDGEWKFLEMPANVQNTNEALLITPDAKMISGWSNKVYNNPVDPTDVWGQYFPVQWKLNEATKEYDLIDYSSVDVLNHQGFVPMCQNADGSIIGGRIYFGVNTSMAALLENGELKFFHETNVTYEPWYFAGKWYCGRDEEGNQVWTTDPNDPRIVLFEENYVDGWHDDGKGQVNGFFDYCDAEGNFYGTRTVVSNVSADGDNATFKQYATIYNPTTGEFIDNERAGYYTCGVNPDLVFDGDGNVWVEGVKKDAQSEYGIHSDSEFAGVAKLNGDGTVLGCARREFFEAIGDYMYYPLMVVTKDYSSVKSVAEQAQQPIVVAGRGYVKVLNAATATLIDMDGKVVGTGLNFNPAPGAYIVKAGDTTVKLIVK